MTDFVWPPENTEPVEGMPFYCSGEYSADPLNVSPEGNVYGHERCVVMDPQPYWWTGRTWLEIPTEKGVIVAKGQVHTEAELPPGPRPYSEIWQVRFYNQKKNEYYWVEYFWAAEAEEWQPMNWLWHVESVSKLPTPGHFVGEAHWVLNWHQKYRWVGTGWQRRRHSELANDEPERHLPSGFLQLLEPDFHLIFVSPKEIALEATEFSAGKIWINREWVTPELGVSVFNTLPSLEMDSETGVISAAALEQETEYWIYLANSVFPTPQSSSHDFQGKLFLSRSNPENGLLSRSGSGRNARLMGKVQTDNSYPPRFVKEQNISLISRVASLPEAFREYSDFVLEFVDQDTLVLRQLDGTHGQIAIASKLYAVPSDCIILRTDPWIEWAGGSADDPVILRDTPLSPDTVYYVYLPAEDIDAFNFNAINSNTKRPWDEMDEGAEESYNPDLDLRLWPYLSPQTPDHGRLSEQAPGWYCRHIGQVRTDQNGNFVNGRDLSQIRQPTLNPSHHDGLAEASITPVNETEFKVVRKGGTSGIVIVGGSPVQTYEKFDTDVHRVSNSDLVQQYTESNINAPLSDLNAVSTYTQDLYLYLANHRSFWGNHAGKLFMSAIAPTQGYLSRNWPGSQARWLATIRTDANGKFSGSFIRDALTQATLKVDDAATTLNDTWSSAKIQAELNKLWAGINAANVYNTQKISGCGLRLEYRDTTHLAVVPVAESAIVVFPDMATTRSIDDEILLDVTGSTNTMYYVWLKATSIEINTTAPTATYAKMAVHEGNNAILLGYFCCVSTNTMSGVQNVYSYVHEPAREWSATVNVSSFGIGQKPNGFYEELRQTVIALPGLLVPPGVGAALSRPSGITRWFFKWGTFQTVYRPDMTGVGSDSYLWNYQSLWAEGTLTISFNPGASISTGIYHQVSLDILLQVEHHDNSTVLDFTVEFHTGTVVLTRPGS